MGRSDTSTASLDIKILLSDLVDQINETNVALIKKMLFNGFNEDINDFYNETYQQIAYYDDYNLSNNYKLPEDYLELKSHLITEFKTHGSLLKSKFSSIVTPDLSDGCLLEKELLVPVEDILSTERWGYNREGVNAMSTDIDNLKSILLSLNLEEYKDIKHFKIVFMIKQDAN